ncbi:MAG: NAD-dependent epimerase/dehydratase family protein [Planctomycetaceae bacterium]|nr:NAD-dependent epimerase/dehydratase family protein [Planctomycetaceae bacterium]
MQRVLLTGATGFIGHHLIERLQKEDCIVRCFVRNPEKTPVLFSGTVSRPLEIVQGDVLRPETLPAAVADCDVAVHLAGKVRARNYKEFEETNVHGTENLLNAAQQTGKLNRFVYVSSLAAAGPARPEAPKRETNVPVPVTDYGRSKLAAEQVVRKFADDFPCSLVRPCIVFGERDKMNLELFQTVKKLGFMPNPGFRKRYYSWIHAADLADLIVKVIYRGERIKPELPDKGVYFASANNGLCLKDIGTEIGRSLGREKTMLFRCPPMAVWSTATYYEVVKQLTGRDVPYDWAKAYESVKPWCCSSDKAAEQLDFSPPLLAKRIQQTTDWYEKNGLL